jgi:hypothetical protein
MTFAVALHQADWRVVMVRSTSKHENGPDIARVAVLVADPVRSAMLLGLMAVP